MMGVSLNSTSAPGVASSTPSGMRSPGLSNRLNTNGIDVPKADESCIAKITRVIVGCTGKCFTPMQMLILLRILKTVTVLFLFFTIIADTMYIVFVKFMASSVVDLKVGGPRDTIIRIYGLVLAIMALSIELEFVPLFKHFPGFKGFVPRSLLLFFITAITSASPLHASQKTWNDGYIDDDRYDQSVTSEIPHSTVAFQMVTSFVLLLCSLAYFVFGLLCFDRFTRDAFLTYNDPVQETAIPQLASPGSVDTSGESLSDYSQL